MGQDQITRPGRNQGAITVPLLVPLGGGGDWYGAGNQGQTRSGSVSQLGQTLTIVCRANNRWPLWALTGSQRDMRGQGSAPCSLLSVAPCVAVVDASGVCHAGKPSVSPSPRFHTSATMRSSAFLRLCVFVAGVSLLALLRSGLWEARGSWQLLPPPAMTAAPDTLAGGWLVAQYWVRAAGTLPRRRPASRPIASGAAAVGLAGPACDSPPRPSLAPSGAMAPGRPEHERRPPPPDEVALGAPRQPQEDRAPGNGHGEKAGRHVPQRPLGGQIPRSPQVSRQQSYGAAQAVSQPCFTAALRVPVVKRRRLRGGGACCRLCASCRLCGMQCLVLGVRWCPNSISNVGQGYAPPQVFLRQG